MEPRSPNLGGTPGAHPATAPRSHQDDAALLAALVELTALLSAAMTEDDVARVVAEFGATALGASAAFVVVASEDRTALEMLAHLRDGALVDRCVLDTAATLPVVEAWRLEMPILAHTADELYARYPSMDRARAGREATASLPLSVDGSTIGAMHLTFATPQAFGPQQQSAMAALAQLCAQALRRAELTRSIERLRHDFVATASHELRTPLAAIHGIAMTLVDPALRLDLPTRSGLLDVLLSQTERMTRVVDDLELTSQLDAGGARVTPERVDIGDAAERAALPWSQHPVHADRVRIELPDSPVHARCDPVRLQQVLGNLLDNALKYSPAGTPVRLVVDGGDEGPVTIRVIDAGPGVAVAHRERVLEKFFRIDATHRNGVSGLGLGLYLCRRLLEAMDGRLALEGGADGIGLVACVELPRATLVSTG